MRKTNKIFITLFTIISMLSVITFNIYAEETDTENPIDPIDSILLTQTNDIDYTNQLDDISHNIADIKNNLHDIYDDVYNTKIFNEYVIKRTIRQYPFIMSMFSVYKYSYYNLIPTLDKKLYNELLSNLDLKNKNIVIFYDLYKPNKLLININDNNIVASTFHTSSYSLKFNYTYDIEGNIFANEQDKLISDNAMILYLQIDGCVLYDGLTDINNQIDIEQQQPIDLTPIAEYMPIIIVLILFLLFKNLIWGVD